MTQSVILKNGEAFSNTNGQAQVPADRVVAINSNPIRQSEVNKVQLGEGSTKADNTRNVKVSSGNPVAAGGDPFMDVQDAFSRKVSDPRKISDDCSIPIANTRVSVKTALDMGLIKVDGQGNYEVVEQQAPAKVEATPKETLVYHEDQQTLNEFYTRGVSPDAMDSYMSGLVSLMINKQPADAHIANFAQMSGCSERTLHSWSESYLNNLYSASLDAAVQKSSGMTTGEIESHIEKCSKSFKTQLLLSMHLGNTKMIDQLVTVVKTGRIV